MSSCIRQFITQVVSGVVIAIATSWAARADSVPTPTEADAQQDTIQDSKEAQEINAVLQIFHESRYDGTRASGLSVFLAATASEPELPLTAYIGLTAEQISSPNITYNGQPDRLESLYLFVGASVNWPISPFLEAGLDLGDSLAQEYLRSDQEQENSKNITDTCWAIGIQTRLKPQSLYLRAYYRMYVISQEDRITHVPVAGVGLGMAF